jgi:hypothetical protein|tara:strand:- start:1109 stop:1309 length:201 start_codon:yes stop_codon:yes gene_type:complete
MSILPKLRWRTTRELKANIFPTIIEAVGFGMVIGGVWFLNEIIAVIITGILLVVIAQVISSGRNSQ